MSEKSPYRADGISAFARPAKKEKKVFRGLFSTRGARKAGKPAKKCAHEGCYRLGAVGHFHATVFVK